MTDDHAEPADTIALQDFLKLIGMVRSGGEAKLLIQGGAVRVDGEVETRRRRKLRGGELIELNGERVTVERLPADQNRPHG